MKKIAVVTGASSGMGREMVYQLADRFAGLSEIWVIARRGDRLLELSGRVPKRIRPFALDLMKEGDRAVLAAALKEEKPEIKFLVNAAGFGMTGAVGSIPAEKSLEMIRLNDEALVAVTELALPYLLGSSRIIQFASAAAFLPQPGFAVYAATKSFVLSYSRALAEELRHRGICVTAVCPGPVDTEFFGIALRGGTLKSYKKLLLENPKTVVRRAVKDSMMGRQISIASPVMRLFFLLCKVLPHQLLMRMITW